MFSDKDEEVQERDEFRKDRAKERQRERNIARAAPDKRFVYMLCSSCLLFSQGIIELTTCCLLARPGVVSATSDDLLRARPAGRCFCDVRRRVACSPGQVLFHNRLQWFWDQSFAVGPKSLD